MNAGRWYPTNPTLANGDVLVTSGTIDLVIGSNIVPQVYQAATGTWRTLLATLEQPDYPWMFLAPDGRVFYAGPEQVSRFLDPSGAGSWTVAPTSNFGLRVTGSAVMYDVGKVLRAGGGVPPTATAEVIDLTTPLPVWRSVAPMTFPRQNNNATLLPDGTVLVSGGTASAVFNDPDLSVFTSELWDPSTESWSRLADAHVSRLYHSTALLLPDGRVIATGGNYWGGHPELEIFEPPYLFRGPRPSVAAPPSVRYSEAFLVATPDADRIAQVTWLRLGSVTHAFDQNQRFSRLAFSAGPGGLVVHPPGRAPASPPGHYLLVVVDQAGVPAVGQIVQIH